MSPEGLTEYIKTHNECHIYIEKSTKKEGSYEICSCHIFTTVHLLTCHKRTLNEICNILSKCYKQNYLFKLTIDFTHEFEFDNLICYHLAIFIGEQIHTKREYLSKITTRILEINDEKTYRAVYFSSIQANYVKYYIYGYCHSFKKVLQDIFSFENDNLSQPGAQRVRQILLSNDDVYLSKKKYSEEIWILYFLIVSGLSEKGLWNKFLTGGLLYDPRLIYRWIIYL